MLACLLITKTSLASCRFCRLAIRGMAYHNDARLTLVFIPRLWTYRLYAHCSWRAQMWLTLHEQVWRYLCHCRRQQPQPEGLAVPTDSFNPSLFVSFSRKVPNRRPPAPSFPAHLSIFAQARLLIIFGDAG